MISPENFNNGKSPKNSLVADATKLIALRQNLGWTQEDAAKRSGYSVRLIRKIEKQGAVRPQTLRDVLQCYHEAVGNTDWEFDQFLFITAPNQASPGFQANCVNCKRLKAYFIQVFCERKKHLISDYCSPCIQLRAEGAVKVGIDSIYQRAEALLSAFDPIEFTFGPIYSFAQVVHLSWSTRQRHTGTFFDIPATGRWVNLRGMSIAKFENGLVVEAEDHFDVESILRQIRGEAPRTI